ncbi:MAG: DNA recombination protein RmuC [Oligosphaeraceae bacterium]|nr:DNA recombination protein RmuC [Oligosphaeraceae bacterium]
MLKLRTTRLALELSAVQARYSEAKEQLALLSAQASAAVAQNHQLSLELTRAKAETEFLQQNLEQQSARWQQAQQEQKSANETAQKEQERHWQERLQALKEEFAALAEKTLSARSSDLRAANQEQLALLLAPMADKITAFKAAVENKGEKDLELIAALNSHISSIQAETRRIGTEANDLARALRGDHKAQGNWGEMILEKILEQSGLLKEREYETQVTLRDANGRVLKNAEGRSLIADAVIYYPDRKAVVVDSKVSLVSLLDYQNASSDPQRTAAAQRFLQSVEQHTRSLSSKDYAGNLSNSSLDAVDFVIMFIPVDAAYTLLQQEKPGFWQEAFQKKVVIVNPHNLIPLLRLVQIAWQRSTALDNVREIISTAEEILSRLNAFLNEFDHIQDSLNRAQEAWTTAAGKLKDEKNKQSVIRSAQKMRALGASLPRAGKINPSWQVNQLQESSELDCSASTISPPVQ